jgi:hypothetical protein
MKELRTLLLLVTSIPAIAENWAVPVDPTSSSILATLNSAALGRTIPCGPGTFEMTGPLEIPCSSSLSSTEPIASTATATLTKYNFLTVSGCSGVTIEHNRLSDQPGDQTQGNDSGKHIRGSGQNPLSDVVIGCNIFPSPNDCNGVTPQTCDQGGLCSRITWQSTTRGTAMENNTFFRLEEGIKLVCVGSCDFSSSVAENSATLKNKNLQQVHPIGIEIRPQEESLAICPGDLYGIQMTNWGSGTTTNLSVFATVEES